MALLLFPTAWGYAFQKDKPDKLNEIEREIQDDIDRIALLYRGRLYKDEFLQGYITELGQALVPKEVPEGILFSFRVIDDPIPNAVALPDGRIFIHSGLLTFVENEAQLVTILGHEIGHVIERHVVEAIKEARSLKRGLFAAIAGAATAAITRDEQAAQTAMQITASVQNSNYSRKQEDEADLIGCSLAMNGGYDPAEALGFFGKLRARFGEQDRLSNLLVGSHSLNEDRMKNIQKLIDGELSDEYNQKKGAGELTVGSGLLRLHTSQMIRETAHKLAEVYDRYDLALELLESIMDVRAKDPKTLWYLGKIHRLVARTEEQKNQALDLLQRAVEADQRNLYPEINKDFALMLASRTRNLPAAVESLKRYVVGYSEKYHSYPPDLEDIYDYLLLFGDGSWTAPKVDPSFLWIHAISQAGERSSAGSPDDTVTSSAPGAPMLATQEKKKNQ
jgi:predicted Zn-dependent protease